MSGQERAPNQIVVRMSNPVYRRFDRGSFAPSWLPGFRRFPGLVRTPQCESCEPQKLRTETDYDSDTEKPVANSPARESGGGVRRILSPTFVGVNLFFAPLQFRQIAAARSGC